MVVALTHTTNCSSLGFPLKLFPGLNVIVGNGERMVGEGIVRNLNLDLCICDYHIIVDTYVLAVMGSDVVLGSSWLATLGARIADYSTAFFFLGWEICHITRGTTLSISHQHNLFKRFQDTGAIA